MKTEPFASPDPPAEPNGIVAANPFGSGMANTEGFARTYDDSKPPTSPFARPHPRAKTNRQVGIIPDPSRMANLPVGSSPNPTRMANPHRLGSRDPASLLKNRSWDASSERKAIGNERTRRPCCGSSTGCSPSGFRVPVQGGRGSSDDQPGVRRADTDRLRRISDRPRDCSSRASRSLCAGHLSFGWVSGLFAKPVAVSVN